MLLFVFSRHRILGNSLLLYHRMQVWLGPEIQLRLSIHRDGRLFPAPPPSHLLIWGENRPSLSSHCPVAGVLTVRSYYKLCVQRENPSVLILLPHGYVAHCGSHIILFISNKSHLFIIPGKKVSCLFELGCQFAHSITPLAVLSHLSASLECL